MIGSPPGRGPSALLPLTYLVTAASAFVVAVLSVPWLAAELGGHYYHPRLLALTHTITLGWITLTIMGASYQLMPIVLGQPIWSERLARWQFVVFVVGLIGLVGHFVISRWSGLVWGAGLIGLAVALHVLNASLSVRGLHRWTFTARLVALALVGLALTALAGLALGVDKLVKFLPGQIFPNLHAHVHLALLGWVMPMVLGVAARVYPMFLLGREPRGWHGTLQMWGLALGVPLVVGGLATRQQALLDLGVLGVTTAVAGHLGWIVVMVRSRKRPALDWGLRFTLTGAAFLVPATALGLGLAFDLVSGSKAALAYAVLGLGGWVSLTIVGMMLKIVPFLVWYRAYGPHVGRAPVPTLPELGWPAAEATAFAALTGGVAGLALALFVGGPAGIRLAGLLLSVGALAFAGTLVRTLSHLRWAPTLPEPHVLPSRERAS